MELKEYAQTYLDLREIYEEARKVSNAAEKEWRKAESELIEHMQEAHVGSWKDTETKHQFTLAENTSISCAQTNYDAIRNWVHDQTGDEGPFLMEIPSKKAVLAFVKDKVAANRQTGDPDSHGLPDFLNLKTRPILRLVRGDK